MTIQPPGHLSYGLLLRAMGTASQALGHRAGHAVMLLQSSGEQNEMAEPHGLLCRQPPIDHQLTASYERRLVGG